MVQPPASEPRKLDSATAEVANLLAFDESGSTLQFDVISTGCTQRQDFEIVIEKLEDGRVELTVLRLRPDDCRRMPAAKRLDYSREALGLENEQIILINPLVRLPGRG